MAAITYEGSKVHCNVTFSEVSLANSSLCRMSMLLSYGQRNDQLLAGQGNGDDARFNVLAVYMHTLMWTDRRQKTDWLSGGSRQ